MGLPKIAILICSFNESKTLAKVVRDASKFGKVLVINDGSTDNTKEMIKKFKIKGVSTRKPEGITNSDWVLIDAYDIIIHLFRPEVREFYALEKMWEIPKSTNSEIKT